MTEHEIASQVLGAIEWISPTRGYITCPGKHLHTGKSSKRDCRVDLDGAPTIHCFHSSCSSPVEQTNKVLRQSINNLNPIQKRIPTEEEKKQVAAKKQKAFIDESLKQLAETKLEKILKDYEWPVADAWEASSIWTDDCEQDWVLFLSLFSNDDVIWSGEVTDSGSKSNQKNFLTPNEIRKLGRPLGRFTCPATFKPGSFSRSNENVVARKFLVIESDVLNQDQICAVFRFCSQFLKLKAIVFTGGKSLHGWFDYPSQETINVLKVLLPSLKCDQALFKPSQPVRMPGMIREPGKYQSLIYFHP